MGPAAGIKHARMCLLSCAWCCTCRRRKRRRRGPVQGRLYRSLKLWSFYCDLEESLGTLESTQAVYERILDLRIATPQLILNYALFLQVLLPQACPLPPHSCFP